MPGMGAHPIPADGRRGRVEGLEKAEQESKNTHGNTPCVF
jgi:hypothetical protein